MEKKARLKTLEDYKQKRNLLMPAYYTAWGIMGVLLTLSVLVEALCATKPWLYVAFAVVFMFLYRVFSAAYIAAVFDDSTPKRYFEHVFAVLIKNPMYELAASLLWGVWVIFVNIFPIVSAWIVTALAFIFCTGVCRTAAALYAADGAAPDMKTVLWVFIRRIWRILKYIGVWIPEFLLRFLGSFAASLPIMYLYFSGALPAWLYVLAFCAIALFVFAPFIPPFARGFIFMIKIKVEPPAKKPGKKEKEVKSDTKELWSDTE